MAYQGKHVAKTLHSRPRLGRGKRWRSVLAARAASRLRSASLTARRASILQPENLKLGNAELLAPVERKYHEFVKREATEEKISVNRIIVVGKARGNEVKWRVIAAGKRISAGYSRVDPFSSKTKDRQDLRPKWMAAVGSEVTLTGLNSRIVWGLEMLYHRVLLTMLDEYKIACESKGILDMCEKKKLAVMWAVHRVDDGHRVQGNVNGVRGVGDKDAKLRATVED
ncbi:hypothetical protein B0H16DRAFT_1484246 [Mycena metata]|uniref:Uncharacterized protein n=1 Tax=Mycena metata TaxID=1033252 RepID=A0AAD7DUB3_9AGAR|nr:hypothetical protein B0H16DRAFT_1484246 [Mycena metata]